MLVLNIVVKFHKVVIKIAGLKRPDTVKNGINSKSKGDNV